MGLRGLRLSTGGAERRSTGLPRLLGALAVMTTAATGVIVPEAAADGVLGDSRMYAVAESRAPTPTMAPTPPPAPAHSLGGEMARAGSAAERLWLLGGVALSLTAAGVVAIAATRGRRNQ